MSHRSIRSTLVPVASGLAAVIAVSWTAPAHAAAGRLVVRGTASGSTAPQHRRGPRRPGRGMVAQRPARAAGLAVRTGLRGHRGRARHGRRYPAQGSGPGSVTTGPDYSGSGRTAGGPFWGVNGTEVAGVIAGHGHGTGRALDGIMGVAPGATILSVRVSLEFNDPLTSDRAVAGEAARGHRQRHHLRGKPRGADHRPAAGPGDGGADRAGHPGRGRRQRDRAGRGGGTHCARTWC